MVFKHINILQKIYAWARADDVLHFKGMDYLLES